MQLAAPRFGLRVEVAPLWRRARATILPGTRMPAGPEIEGDNLAVLIEAIAARLDRNAFATLFDYYAPRIKGFLMRRNTSPGAAEELAQEALLTVWRKAGQFDRARAGASAWVFAIARNLRIDSARREQRALLLADPSEAPEAPLTPDNEILASERDEQVRAALAQLSAEQIRVVQLAFFEGKPHSDIADELKLPLGTVKSRLRLAMKRLHELLVDP